MTSELVDNNFHILSILTNKINTKTHVQGHHSMRLDVENMNPGSNRQKTGAAILHFFILEIRAKTFFFGLTFLKNVNFGFLEIPRVGMSRIDNELFSRV